MGNFTVGHATSINLDGSHLTLRYRIDLAELPTAEEHLSEVTTPEQIRAYLDRKVPKFMAGQTLRINGNAVELEVIHSEMAQRPGAGDLPTVLINIDCMATVDTSGNRLVLEYEDTNIPARKGWREISVAAWQGWKIVESDVPAQSATQLLENYPTNIDVKPPNQRTAKVIFERSTGTAAAQPVPAATPARRSSNTPRDRFTELLNGGRLSTGAMLIAFVIAFAMGSFHALSPGHGKTVVAAYLVGSRGTPSHAVLLGAVVTFTHVAGVVTLGLVVLFASGNNITEPVSRWLEFISGLLIAAIGVWQFTRRLAVAYATRWQPTAHLTPVPDYHSHGPGGHSHEMPDRITVGALVALGVSGGIVPCPSALVVMLSAIALHRVALGLSLIIAFSVGMAAVLIAIGLLMLYARRALDGVKSAEVWMKKIAIVSAAVIAAIGIGLAALAIRGMA